MTESVPDPSLIEVTYEKSNLFRVVHADGCYGGSTPRGLLHFAFYSERPPIPRRAEISVVDGNIGAERITETKQGVFREVECDVFMDFSSAILFHTWLGNHLESMRKILAISDTDWSRLQGQTS